jgi:aryl-alcohol dehydrogenase-like predicted oxidoreductase
MQEYPTVTVTRDEVDVPVGALHNLPDSTKVVINVVTARALGRGVLSSVEATGDSSRARESSREDSIMNALRLIAEHRGRNVNQVALGWLLRSDDSVIPIPGAMKVSQAFENDEALDWILGQAEFNELEKIASPK